jgi:hypothetical protein
MSIRILAELTGFVLVFSFLSLKVCLQVVHQSFLSDGNIKTQRALNFCENLAKGTGLLN